MQRKKWISGLCIAMAVALVFTGCGHKKSSKEEKGTTVSSGTVVMMVGDDQVRYSEVMAYCYFLKCQYEDSFGKELWQYKLDDNETIGDQAKQEIVNMITQLKVISDVAQQQEVSLSADEQDEALRQAESLVQKLPGELQAVVCGKYYEGLNSSEIGKSLGIPASTVRTRLRAALSLMRGMMKGEI